jgi:hypothetical protein
LHIAERAIISFDPPTVKYGDELLASYGWLGDTDIPVFEFVEKLENSHWSTEHMERKQNEALYWRDALTDIFSPTEIIKNSSPYWPLLRDWESKNGR